MKQAKTRNPDERIAPLPPAATAEPPRRVYSKPTLKTLGALQSVAGSAADVTDGTVDPSGQPTW